MMVPTNTEMATATRAITVHAIDALQVPGCSHSRAKSQHRLGVKLRYTRLGDIENLRNVGERQVLVVIQRKNEPFPLWKLAHYLSNNGTKLFGFDRHDRGM